MINKVFKAILIIMFLSMTMMPAALYASAAELEFAIGSYGNSIMGGTITVPITVSNNPGFTAIGLQVTYDPNVLKIVSITAPVAEMPLNSQFALTMTQGTQWIHLVNTSFEDWKGNGNVVNISFNVRSSAPIGLSSINMAFTSSPDGTPGNANGDIIRNSILVSGNINIVDNYVNTLSPLPQTSAPTPLPQTSASTLLPQTSVPTPLPTPVGQSEEQISSTVPLTF